MRKTYTASALALLLAWSPQARAGDFALIIGVSQYQDQNIPHLAYPDADADQVALELINGNSFAPDCITVLKNAAAGKAAIMRAFADLNKRCGAKNPGQGVALIFFAGHGVAAGVNAWGDDSIELFDKTDSSQSREFLVPYDADMSATIRLRAGGAENNTFIKKEEFASLIGGAQSQHIAVILDSCDSGVPDFNELMEFYSEDATVQTTRIGGNGSRRVHAVFGGSAEDGPQKRAALISAANETSEAKEFEDLQHGALSYAILQTLENFRTRTPRGERVTVRMDELYLGVRDVFQEKIVRGRALIDYQVPQVYFYPEAADVPVEFASLPGKFVAPPETLLARAEPLPAPAPAPVQVPVAVQAAALPPQPSAAPAPVHVPQTLVVAAVAAPIAPSQPPAPPPDVLDAAPPADPPAPIAVASATASVAQPSPDVLDVAPTAELPAPMTVAVLAPALTPPARPQAPAPPTEGVLMIGGSIPSGAYLEVDNDAIAWQPGEAVRLPAGIHIVSVVDPALKYRTVNNVEIAANETNTLTLVFTGTLSIESRRKASPRRGFGPALTVLLDGEVIGNGQQLTFSGIAAGTHTLTVRAGDAEKTRDVSIRPDSPILIQYLVAVVGGAKPIKRNDIPL